MEHPGLHGREPPPAVLAATDRQMQPTGNYGEEGQPTTGQLGATATSV